MAEIDPVILELRAEMGKFRADLKNSADQTNRNFARMERDTQRLEKQMLKSSTAISSSFRNLAGSLAAAFSVTQIQQLADGYTRFTNQLKVTGLEGKKLAGTQDKLFQIAQQYGTELEAVGSLYSRAAQSSAELNATQGQLLSTTEAVAASLKISGTSATQAQGALLQLGQALGSPRIQAEEFNSLLDTMQPLLREVAKRIDGTGGTIGGLTRKIKDLKGEGVSNVEFFRAINDSLADLQKTAASSTLTIGNSFTVLNNALGKYIGEADKSLSATEQLSGAIISLANNLDTIIPALATIITIIGVQYVAAAGRAAAANIALAGSATGSAAAMGALGAAAFATQARLAGAATAMEAAAFAARGMGASLLAAVGGPVGAAVIALGAGLAYVASQSGVAAQATGEYAKQARALAEIQDKVASATERVASATGKARAEALANAKALREETKQYLANAQAALIAAQAKAIEVRNRARQELQSLPINSGAGGGPDRLNGVLQRNTRPVIDANANAKAAEAAVIGFQKELNRLTGIIEAAAPPAIAAVGDGKPDKKTSGPSGPSASDIARRFYGEINSLDQQALAARQALATSAEERAELEIRSVELARRNALESLKAEKDYSAEQKARIAERLDKIASLEAERIEREKRIRLAEEAANLADAQFRADSDALRQQYDLAKSQAERRRLAFEIIDLEYRERDAALERIKNNEDLADAVRQRAAIEQEALREAQGRTVEQARRDTAGPLENYFDRARMDADELNEAYQQVAVDGLGAVQNALADTAAEYIKLGGVAGKIVNGIIADLIRLAIQQQIVGLFGDLFSSALSIGNSGSSVKSGFKTAGARAGGGPVSAGNLYRVNEAGMEYFQPANSGRIIPVGEMNARAAQPVSARQGPIELRVYADRGAFISDVEAISEGQAVKVTMAAAGPLTERAVQTTMGRLNRPRMPGAGR